MPRDVANKNHSRASCVILRRWERNYKERMKKDGMPLTVFSVHADAIGNSRGKSYSLGNISYSTRKQR